MNKQVIMLVMVIALVALAGVQAYQINDLKSDISDGTLNIDIGSGVAAGNAAKVSTARQQAAPAMVGGC